MRLPPRGSPADKRARFRASMLIERRRREAALQAQAMGAEEAGSKSNQPPKPRPRFIYRRPVLYPKQHEAIFDPKDLNGDPARYSVVEASTKAGKTHGCICWLAERAILDGKEGRNFWWVAPVYNQAKIAFRRMRRALDKRLIRSITATPMCIILINGATIDFKTAEKPDNLYGEDVHAVVIDEASRCREESFTAVRSTLTATNGPVRAIGNVKGRGNWFYKLARKAEAGEPGYARYKMTAYDAVEGGVLKLEEVEDARRMLPDIVFRELYLAEPADDGGNPFGLAAIDACVSPMSTVAPVAVGGDLAKKQDWTVIVGLDRRGNVCGMERWQKVDWDRTTKALIDIIGALPALIDATGVGDPIVERVQKKCRRAEGFIFSAKSKQMLMEGLAVAIQQREITFPDGPIKAELENFEYVYTRTGVLYSAPEGYHDDCVMALALAVEAWRRLGGFGGSRVPPSGGRISPWLGAHTHT